jgi:hypothetical protein
MTPSKTVDLERPQNKCDGLIVIHTCDYHGAKDSLWSQQCRRHIVPVAISITVVVLWCHSILEVVTDELIGVQGKNRLRIELEATAQRESCSDSSQH